jgi:hypothetical protein
LVAVLQVTDEAQLLIVVHSAQMSAPVGRAASST